MILQSQNEGAHQNNKVKHPTQEDLNYKYFYIDRKLSINNVTEMPQTLNQLEIFMEQLLSSHHNHHQKKQNQPQQQFKSLQKIKKQRTFKLQLLNSIVIRILDLMLNLKIFYLKNKIKKLLIRYNKQISLVHNKEEICQVLYKCLRGADEFTRIIAAEIIPSYCCLFQKDLFAYHYLLEQLMVNRINIYSKQQKKAILNCLKGLLQNSKYISRLFLNDLQKLVINISFQTKKYNNSHISMQKQKDKKDEIQVQSQEAREIESFIVKNFGIKPQILIMFASVAIFSGSQTYKILQTLLKIISNFEYCANMMQIQSKMIKKCYKYIRKIFLKSLPQNYKLIQLFFAHNLVQKLKIGNFGLKQVMNLQYSKSQDFIIKNLSSEYQEQLIKIMKQQNSQKIKNNSANLLDYFFQVKKRNIYISLFNSNSQQFKANLAQMETILKIFFQKMKIKSLQIQKNFQEFKNVVLFTYYNENSYDLQIQKYLKSAFKQKSIGYNKQFCKLLKIFLTTGNFKSAKFIIKHLQQKTIGPQNKNLLFWKLYCQCYLFEQEKENTQVSESKKTIISKIKNFLILREVAKQFKLDIFELLQIWITIYKSLIIFCQNNTSPLQKKHTFQYLRTTILKFELKVKKSNSRDQLKEQLLAMKQIFNELKTNNSYEKLNSYINKRKKYPTAFNDLMKCLYFSKQTILSIHKQLK